MATQSEVLFEVGPTAAVATLNRTKALNSLNDNMCILLKARYIAWEADERVHAIILKGAGKAFCAGGDVKAVVLEILAGRPDIAKGFFRNEYELDHFLGTLSKPHIALLDGTVMGGGAGLSMHGAFRVATERTLFAMPECGIGLFPDVGASHFLSKLPSEMGTYLALTGTRLKGMEVLEAGLATHFVPSAQLPALEEQIQALGPKARDHTVLSQLLTRFQEELGRLEPTGLCDNLAAIGECFAHDDVESIIAALRERETGWTNAALAKMSQESPLSQKITLRLMREGAGKSLASCLRTDYRLVERMVDGPSDFVEGIRALLIDKTKDPTWKPATLEQVTEEQVGRFFAPLPPEKELTFFRHSNQKSKL